MLWDMSVKKAFSFGRGALIILYISASVIV